MFNINELLNKLLFELKFFNPKYCRQFDDPRLDNYYISINQNYYIVLYGICEECDTICFYNNKNMDYDIMTTEGIEEFANDENMEVDILFEIILDEKDELYEPNEFNNNIDDLIFHVVNSVKKYVPF